MEVQIVFASELPTRRNKAATTFECEFAALSRALVTHAHPDKMASVPQQSQPTHQQQPQRVSYQEIAS